MRISFEVSDEEVRRVRTFFDTWRDNRFVKRRKERNIDGDRRPANSDQFWEALVSALLTTQQRSGPQSAVARFISKSPFPLSLKACRDNRPCDVFAATHITDFGGIRRGPTIGKQLESNLEWLEHGGWASVLPRLSSLETNPTHELERDTARFLHDKLEGLGPKQARNLLQMLGLTRYEIPIDSRITKWLNQFGFPVHLTAASLSDSDYYEFVLDGFQSLCEKADLLPCLMDAAIFASFDRSAWDNKQDMRW